MDINVNKELKEQIEYLNNIENCMQVVHSKTTSNFHNIEIGKL